MNVINYYFIVLIIRHHSDAVSWMTEGHPACKKFCHINAQRFTFGDWPNLDWLQKNKPIKQSEYQYVCYYYYYLHTYTTLYK